MIRAVTFDFWNTLIGESADAWERRVGAQRDALARAGVERSVADIEAATTEIRAWFDARWHRNEVVDPLIGATQMAVVLGLEPSSPAIEELATVYAAGSEPARLVPAAGIGDALEALRSAGVRVGIICDAGFSPGAMLRRYLDHHGLLGYFDHWSFSDEVGVFKPDAQIFAHAAAGLGVDDASALAHVGDLRRTDVAGARAVGWTAVRYRGLNDDAPSEDDPDDAAHVIDHHDALIAVLSS